MKLALDLGEIEGDCYVLTRKIIDAEMSDLQSKIKLLAEVRKKGGISVVAVGDKAITTYRLGGSQHN